MDNILEINGLCKAWPGFKLDNVSFSIPQGYIMGFIGPNGAGKTTTIKLIMNLIHKDSGSIQVFGLDHVKHPKTIRDRIGFVYDEDYFYENLNPNELKQIIAPFYSRWDESSFKKYMGEFRIPPKVKYKNLSKGEKMKLALALALSHNADLIILDEPTSGLDPVFRSELLDILARLIEDESRSVLFSTHITSDLQRIADYICFINQGRIMLCEDRDQLLNRYVVVKGPTELLNQEIRPLFNGIREHAFGFEALSERSQEVNRRLGGQVVVEKANLEDIMLLMIRGDKIV